MQREHLEPLLEVETDRFVEELLREQADNAGPSSPDIYA
jgi:hypothetical protein